MELQVSEIGGVTRAALDGRLDTLGVGQIETRFIAALVGAERPVIVDLSAVPFLASLGIRMLLSTAQPLGRRGHKMVLFGAVPEVAEIIETTALSDIIPVAATETEALALATAG